MKQFTRVPVAKYSKPQRVQTGFAETVASNTLPQAPRVMSNDEEMTKLESHYVKFVELRHWSFGIILSQQSERIPDELKRLTVSQEFGVAPYFVITFSFPRRARVPVAKYSKPQRVQTGFAETVASNTLPQAPRVMSNDEEMTKLESHYVKFVELRHWSFGIILSQQSERIPDELKRLTVSQEFGVAPYFVITFSFPRCAAAELA